MIVEQVMTFQSQEVASDVTITRTGDLSYRDLRIVVADPNRHAVEESERSLVTFEKCFCAFPRKRLYKNRVLYQSPSAIVAMLVAESFKNPL